MEPYLKYPGGKRRLLPVLRPYFAPYLTEGYGFADATCGSMAVALGLCARKNVRVVVNDVNPHLINLHRWIQRGLDVKNLGIDWRYDRATYISQRMRFNEIVKADPSSPQAAGLLYYLNRCGFNGLMRFNSRGEFNVPFGRYKDVRFIKDFSPWQEAIAGWQITSGDFEDIEIPERSFLYADPPYFCPAETDGCQPVLSLAGGAPDSALPIQRSAKESRGFTAYSGDRFTATDQVRLAKFLAAHPGPVLTQNRASPFICNLYEGLGFQVKTLMVGRSINRDGKKRQPVEEVIAFKP